MAKTVGYFQGTTDDDPIFSEGPFVICNPMGGGWRIEVQVLGARCPALPSVSISLLQAEKYGIRFEKGSCGQMRRKKDAEEVCDWLNQLVKEGEIVLDGAWWVSTRSEFHIMRHHTL